MAEVPRIATPVAESDVVRQLPGAFNAVGIPLTQAMARLFLGLVFLENGRGAKLFNNNWGNLAAGSSWKGDIWRPDWWSQAKIDARTDGAEKTRLQDLHNRMTNPGNVPGAFRSYRTSAEGLQAFAQLFTADRYRPLLAAAATGQPAAFAAAVKSSGYTPDLNVAAHTASYAALLNEFDHAQQFAALPKTVGGVPSNAQLAGGFAMALLPLFFCSPRGNDGERVPANHWAPLAFQPNGERTVHVAVSRVAFRLRKLQALNALGDAVILDMRVKRTDGQSFSCLTSETALPARVLLDAPRFELPELGAGDELAIFVSGTVSNFVGWGEVG